MSTLNKLRLESQKKLCFQSPCASSSNRAGFVNPYSSVRVRPEAPVYGDHDVTAASRPVKAFVPVRIRLVTPISMGRRWSVILHHKEGVPSVAKALAVRVRFPAWSASVRSRHLSIVICRSSDIRCARLRTASTKFVRKCGLRGQSRSSTEIERPALVREMWVRCPSGATGR